MAGREPSGYCGSVVLLCLFLDFAKEPEPVGTGSLFYIVCESDAVMAEKNEKGNVSASQKLADKVAEKAVSGRHYIVAIIIAAVLITVIAFIYRSRVEAQAIAAENALYKAKMDVAANLGNDYIGIFDRIVSEYPGTPAAAQAIIQQFGYANNASEYETAEKIARNFLKAFSQHQFAPRMRLALGQLLMNDGNLAEARSELEAVQRLNDASYPEATLALAQLLEQEAEAVKDDDAEYKKKLILAREAYSNITSQMESPSSTQYWPQDLRPFAEFSLTLINDKLAGYTHPAPKNQSQPASAVAADASETDLGLIAAPPQAEAETQPDEKQAADNQDETVATPPENNQE